MSQTRSSNSNNNLLSNCKSVCTRPQVWVDSSHCVLWYELWRDTCCPRRHSTNFSVLAEWSQQRRSNLRLHLLRLLSFLLLLFFFFLLTLLNRVPPLTPTLWDNQPTVKEENCRPSVLHIGMAEEDNSPQLPQDAQNTFLTKECNKFVLLFRSAPPNTSASRLEKVFQLFLVLSDFDVDNNVLQIYQNQSTRKLSNPRWCPRWSPKL